MNRLLPMTTILLAGLLAATAAEARTDRMMTYRQGQIWSSLVRFLRVDMGYRILERDREAGYLLFEYKEGGRDCSGSLEMVPVVDSGRRYIRARLQIPSMPTYVEVVLFDKFERKLRSEYGDPPVATPETAAAEAAPEGAGGTAQAPADAKRKPPESEDDTGIDDEDLEDSAEEEEE